MPGSALGITIDLTLAKTLPASGQVEYTIGVVDDSSGLPVSINGYTLDFSFDATELSFAGARQVASFGTVGQIDFSLLNDCSGGRCTGGNIPGFDSDPLAIDALTSLLCGNTAGTKPRALYGSAPPTTERWISSSRTRSASR